jgi:hypothetical protein
MGLSRLSNFLKNVKGNIIYVDPNSLDSTDSVENQGNSLTRPFKTIQRALLEAARFSYQRGKKNDRFLKTTILLYPGDHYIDNRPGYIPTGSSLFSTRSGLVNINASLELDFESNFDILDSVNDLYKFNSVYGGVIVPRGTSIVGLDLRKTKIRPLYVPNPENNEIERTALFRVTGGCYFWQFTVLDGDPNGLIFSDYTGNQTVPNFSHHKLTVFEYADGINSVKIEDDFLTYSTDRTDLQMYYEKIGLGYGAGRTISPDYPSDVDIEPVVDEFRVVGSRGSEVGISQIRSGNGIVGTTEITVTLDREVNELSVDTAIQISGVTEPGYNGQYAVSEVVDNQTFKYIVATVPEQINPNASNARVSITVDTVSSASPYIFNCSLRSVYGMCGLHADGKNATGFQSMVVAQFTGIGLQKDDRAFVRYDKAQGIYISNEPNGHTNSLSRFKPSYENYHIKASNNAFLQLVSVFAIGFANHFLAESGGDHSITNSNSNFGAKSLVSNGFRDSSFIRDDCGYITHIVAPKEIDSEEQTLEYVPIDVQLTRTINNASRLYIYNENDINSPPDYILNGYRFGASKNEKLYLQINDPSSGLGIFTADVVMGDTQSTTANPDLFNIVAEKTYRVGQSNVGINSIVNNTIEFISEHSFRPGESVTLVPKSGSLPDGISPGKTYYVINDSLRTIKLSSNQQDAINGAEQVVFNNKGGIIDVISRVTDKKPNDPGSPLKFDSSAVVSLGGKTAGWYILCNPLTNTVFTKYQSLYPSGPFPEVVSSRTFIKRTPDKRSNDDKIYKFRYVLPKDSTFTSRPPLDGYILQDSSSTNASDVVELSKYFPQASVTLTNPTELRNLRYISNAVWVSNTVTVTTELPHNLNEGSQVSIYNIITDNNPEGEFNKGYNGTFEVIDVSSSREFSYLLPVNPGLFDNNINTRDPESLPRYVNRKLKNTYQIFRSEEIQPYEKDRQDGIYHITLTNSSNSPSVSPFTELSFSQPIQNLYPQLNRDNPNSDPTESFCYALPDPIGQVSINDPQNSITKETLYKNLQDLKFGFDIFDIGSSSGTSHTIYTSREHNLNSILEVSITNSGQNYVPGTYYNISLVGFAGSTTGTKATAIVNINASGVVNSVTILDGGSAYGIGNTLSAVGLSTGASWTNSNSALFTVSNINNSQGIVINVSSVKSVSKTYDQYNGNYIVTSVKTGFPKQIEVESQKTLTQVLPSIGDASDNAIGNISGTALNVNSISYDRISGVGTVGFTTTHPFKSGSTISLYGATNSFYNDKNFVVTRVNSQLSVRINVGKSNSSQSTSGTIKAIPVNYAASGGDINLRDEYSSGRLKYIYDKFTGYVGTQLNNTSSDSTPLVLYNSTLISELKLGDYLLVNNEIMRISQRVTSNSISVIRALLGTKRETHQRNSTVQKIKVFPIEFRRNSIIRASGHTFEYLGFGPGNYSTALPERQDRVLSPQEVILSQSTKIDGGTILYSAMNSDGDFYNNNRKLTSTGKDQIFESPIPTVTGEEPLELTSEGGYNITTPEEIVVNRSIKVNGGKESNLISEFNGPTIFNEKITSTSENGLELRKLNIRGDLDISREIGISTTRPTTAANVGDRVLNALPQIGGNVGWVYATDPTDNQIKWQEYGWINDSLYGVDVTSSALVDAELTRILRFESGNNVNITQQYNESTGITTVTFALTQGAANKVGIVTGNDFGEYFPTLTPSGAPAFATKEVINFVGSSLGFGVKVISEYGQDLNSVGIATIKFQSPVFPINFGTGTELPGTAPNQGLGDPIFAVRSNGTRIIYDQKLTSSATNYAVGRNNNVLWWSVPQNVNSFGYIWYAGINRVADLIVGSATTTFNVYGGIVARDVVESTRFRSTVNDGSTPPFTVSSSVLVSNLNASRVQGEQPEDLNTNASIPSRITNASNQVYIAGISTGLLDGPGDGTGTGRPGSFYTNIPARLGYNPFNKAGDQVTGISTFFQISDVVNTTSSTVSNVISVSFANGPIFRVDGTIGSVDTLNITSVPTTPNRTYNYTVVLNVSGTSNLITKLQINSTIIPASNLRWLNGNIPPTSVSVSDSYIIGFTFFCDASGSFTSSSSYVLGVYGQYSTS